MGRHRFVAAMLIGLLVSLPACSGGANSDGTTSTSQENATGSTGEGGTTTTRGGDGTAPTTVPTTQTDDGATTTTLEQAFEVPEYSIQARISGESGDTVVVSVEPATYSDLDIENLVADVVQRFAPITTVHVVDDPAVVDLVLSEPTALTAEELASRDEHYFARLEEGFRLVFQGPFEQVPEVIIGS